MKIKKNKLKFVANIKLKLKLTLKNCCKMMIIKVTQEKRRKLSGRN